MMIVEEKTKDDYISDIVYDDFKIEEVIQDRPQTYNTILQHMKDNGTLLVILKRRISRLKKEGRVLMSRIPGTRFGMCLFFSPKHDYTVIVNDDLIRKTVYYAKEIQEDKQQIILKNYWILEGSHMDKWTYCDTPVVLKKETSRGGIIAIWD